MEGFTEDEKLVLSKSGELWDLYVSLLAPSADHRHCEIVRLAINDIQRVLAYRLAARVEPKLLRP